MDSINDLYGAFSVQFKMQGETWLLHIIPEMGPAKVGLKALGSYFIYSVHPEKGSITFIIEQDEQMEWYCERLPPFITIDFVKWIGATIEESSK